MKSLTVFDSGFIRGIAYNKEDKSLLVQFESGAGYEYMAVEKEIYLNFAKSKNKGHFFRKNIRDSYQYKTLPKKRFKQK